MAEEYLPPSTPVGAEEKAKRQQALISHSPTSANLTEAGRGLWPMRNHIWLDFISSSSSHV